MSTGRNTCWIRPSTPRRSTIRRSWTSSWRPATSPSTTPRIVHGSEGNTSDSWRIGLTLRYIPTSTRVVAEGWRNILVRGRPDPHNGNCYAERPRYVPGQTMAFRGAEA